jgi:hypothetical protein
MPVSVTGLADLIEGLDRDVALLATTVSHPVLRDRLREPVAEEHQLVFRSKGSAIGATWGSYARDYHGPKREGVTYFLRETGAMSGALIWYAEQVFFHRGNTLVFPVPVPYAEAVYDAYGEYLSASERLDDAVSEVFEEWFADESANAWEVVQ